MNLSSYLQMPPAPSASKSPTTSPAAGPAAGARVDAGNSLGLDFAQIMSRQLESLPQVERQSVAASAPQMKSAPEASRHQTQKRSDVSEDRNADSDERDDGATKRSQNRQQDQDNTAAARQASSGTEDNSQDTQPRAQKTRATQKVLTAQEQIDAALLQAMSPAAPVATVNTTLASTIESKPALQTIALSPQIQIITDPKQAPSNESLAAFAKSMGLDESAIQTLIAGGNSAALSNSGDAMRAALATQDPLTQGVLPTGLQATAVTLNPQSVVQAGNAVATALGDFNANLTQQTAALAQAASGSASLLAPDTPALPGALLPPMSAADLASIEQIQITVMPAAVALNGNASNLPSTLDVLSLMTGDLKEQDIGELNTQFNEAGSNDQPADQQSSSDSGENTSFGQVLNRQANQNAPATSANVHASTHMAEVYDQLSDKLATEMAARMHKQLSDGEWKMKFGLRPAHLGGVEIQLEMKDGKLDAVFRADNPLTRDLLQNSSQRLREALENFGIHAGLVHVGQQGGNAQQNASRNSANQPQVGDNSTLQVKGDASVDSTRVASNKANASLLDLYA
jgi:flagellar hook-length control protein FliK